jgi:hypothetical protein
MPVRAARRGVAGPVLASCLVVGAALVAGCGGSSAGSPPASSAGATAPPGAPPLTGAPLGSTPVTGAQEGAHDRDRAGAALLQPGDLPGPGWVDDAPDRAATVKPEVQAAPLVDCPALADRYPALRAQGAQRSQELIQFTRADPPTKVNEVVSILPSEAAASQTMDALRQPEAEDCFTAMIGVPPDSARQFTHVTVEPWPLPAIADDQLGLGVVIQSTTAGTVNQPGRVGIILLRTGRAIAGLFLFFGGPVDTSDVSIATAAASRLAKAMTA